MSMTSTKIVELPRRTVLKQKTLAEVIYDEIRGRLQRGEIGYDDRILDYEIAAEFECTRMPVRQALLRLVNESFLLGTTRGFVIPRLKESDVQELFELRRLLEPYAAASAAPALTDAQEVALRRAYDETRAAVSRGDLATVIEENVKFRSAWLEAVENQRLRATIQTFSDHAQQVRNQTLRNPETLHVAVECLHALLDGFAKRDAELARQAMLKFILNAEQHYFASTKLNEGLPIPQRK